MSMLTHVGVGVAAGSLGFVSGVIVGKNFARPLIDEESLRRFAKDLVEKAGDDIPKQIAKFKIAISKEEVEAHRVEKKVAEDEQKLLNDQYQELARHIAPLIKREKAA